MKMQNRHGQLTYSTHSVFSAGKFSASSRLHDGGFDYPIQGWERNLVSRPKNGMQINRVPTRPPHYTNLNSVVTLIETCLVVSGTDMSSLIRTDTAAIRQDICTVHYCRGT